MSILQRLYLAHVCGSDKTLVESGQARCLTQSAILTTIPKTQDHYTKCSYRKLTYISHTSTSTNWTKPFSLKYRYPAVTTTVFWQATIQDPNFSFGAHMDKEVQGLYCDDTYILQDSCS